MGGLLLAGIAMATPAAENSPIFLVEIPEAQVSATNQTTINLGSTRIKLIVIYVLRPEADRIDYGQIYPKVNGAAASRTSEVRPGARGKIVRIMLGSRAGFELLPGNNAIDISATDSQGHQYEGRFNLHAPAGVCLGSRSKTLEFPALMDLVRAGVSSERLIRLVLDCGLNFQPAPDMDQKLQDAGASAKLITAIHDPTSPELAEYTSPAVRLEQLLTLLRSGIPEDTIIADVEDHGVSFALTPEAEQQIRGAGGTGALIRTIRFMSGGGTSSKALNALEIIDLLKGGVESNRIFALVQQHGVNFRLDVATEQKLREAGANEKLMMAIRAAAQQYERTH
ncbi:MAG: hypothetical protein HY508_14700 [Acidobacteria bacterium]|nr:hypothetical protein [Acidobacteriota bacterium]